MIDKAAPSQDILELLRQAEAFAKGPDMQALEALLENKSATIQEIQALLPGELLPAVLQLTVPFEEFDPSNSWPPEAKAAYVMAAATYSERFRPLLNHPTVRSYISLKSSEAKAAQAEQRAMFKAQQGVFRPVYVVWDHEFWLERESKLSPVCRVSFHSPDHELLFDTSCDMQDLTFIARRFLQITKSGLERSLPWSQRGVLDISFQEEIGNNIAAMEKELSAIKDYANKLGILPAPPL